MVQIHLINSVIEWERRLEIEQEPHRRRSEPYVNNLAAPQSPLKERRSEVEELSAPGSERHARAALVEVFEA